MAASGFIPIISWLYCARMNFAQIRSFKVPRSGSFHVPHLHHQPVSPLLTTQNARSMSFQRRCSKKENFVETKTETENETESDSQLRKECAPELLIHWFFWRLFFGSIMNVSLCLFSKSNPMWALVFILSLYLMLTLVGSKKRKPRIVSFDHLLGIDAYKAEVQEISSLFNEKEYKKLKAELSNGVLLYGPRGSGKTTLVHALAREAKVSFFPVSARKIVLEDTRADMLKNIFIEARLCSPSIIFIRNIDYILEKNGDCESDPVFIQLLTEMEDCNNNGQVVVVIASTDIPDTVDALMSYGLFYKKVHVGTPDEDGRRKIVGLRLKHVLREEDKEAICHLIASQTSGLVATCLNHIAGAAIRLVCDRGDDHVTVDDVIQALDRVKKRINYEGKKRVAQAHIEKRINYEGIRATRSHTVHD